MSEQTEPELLFQAPKRAFHWWGCLVSTCVHDCQRLRKVLPWEPAEMTSHTVQMRCLHNSLMCLQKFTAKSFPSLAWLTPGLQSRLSPQAGVGTESALAAHWALPILQLLLRLSPVSGPRMPEQLPGICQTQTFLVFLWRYGLHSLKGKNPFAGIHVASRNTRIWELQTGTKNKTSSSQSWSFSVLLHQKENPLWQMDSWNKRCHYTRLLYYKNMPGQVKQRHVASLSLVLNSPTFTFKLKYFLPCNCSGVLISQISWLSSFIINMDLKAESKTI